MVEYQKTYNQFLEFLSSFKDTFSDDYEKKLINLILSNFDEVAQKGTAGGGRAKLLDTLIKAQGDSASSELPTTNVLGEESGFPFTRLDRLEVEHFRGFSNHEQFDLSKSFTFIYGPNGAGKSSICEAIEYAMLGYIQEAISKRIPI
ncbi:MAG: AAA family ATPase, partial [Candidatus Omnitrophica bacterium]|nr:AAA family ATPase [Candidatus Omnitrophota bacterium]